MRALTEGLEWFSLVAFGVIIIVGLGFIIGSYIWEWVNKWVKK